MIPFAKTRAERLASGDPRPSVEERYYNFSYYMYRRMAAVTELSERRLLLSDDAFDEVTRGLQAIRALDVKSLRD